MGWGKEGKRERESVGVPVERERGEGGGPPVVGWERGVEKVKKKKKVV